MRAARPMTVRGPCTRLFTRKSINSVDFVYFLNFNTAIRFKAFNFKRRNEIFIRHRVIRLISDTEYNNFNVLKKRGTEYRFVNIGS